MKNDAKVTFRAPSKLVKKAKDLELNMSSLYRRVLEDAVRNKKVS